MKRINDEEYNAKICLNEKTTDARCARERNVILIEFLIKNGDNCIK